MKPSVRYLFCASLLLAIVCAESLAQGTAQISGTVADSTGARLPGVEVTATQTATSQVRTVVSNETGSYVLPSLPTGPYRLEASLPGFRSFAQTGLVLEVNSNPVINITLQVGQVTETVEVQANAALVETRSVGVGQIMETERILELPLNGRNVTELITLSGAAVQTGSSSGRSIQGQQDIRVAGGLSGSVGYTLDGALHTNRYDNLSLPLPFPDALQEFKVETSALSASQGQSSGAQVNAVTKSGTNQFHGDAFEFLRNDLFNARQYYATTNSTLKRHQFGGTLGGPIVHNKLFFFGGYQGTRTRSDPSDNRGFVPTPAMLAGDFTRVTAASCAAGRAITLNERFADGMPTGFVGNRINPALFSAIALNVVGRLPPAQDECGLVTYGTPNITDEKQIVGKGDWLVNPIHSVMGRVLLQNFKQPIPYTLSPDNILTVGTAGRNDWAKSFAVGDTWLISPTTVVSGRLAVNYTTIFRRGAEFFDMAEMGVKGFYTGYYPKYSVVNVTSGFSLGAGTQNNTTINTFTTSINIDASLSRSTHQIGLGGAVAYWDSNNHGNVFSPGIFTFSGTHTNLGLADFLLGRMSTFRQATPNLNPTQKTYTALYVTDSWRLNQRWTLNYGLRWEPDLPEILKEGTVQNFSEARRTAGIRSTVYKNAPFGFYYPGDPGHPGKRGREINWWTFAPRLGFAWDVNGDGRTSVRASAGIGYDYPNVQMHLWTTISPPWGLDVTLQNPLLEDPWANYSGGSPFPAVFDENARFVTFGGFTTMPYDLDPSQAQSWNLSVQRQLGKDFLVSASYLGNHIVHMLMTAPLNPAIYFPGNADAIGICRAEGYTFRTTASSVCSSVNNTNDRRILSLIDFQQTGTWVGNLAEYQSVGTAGYHGLLLDLRKRATRGLTVSSNYTWSHCLASDQDTLNGSLYDSASTYIYLNNRNRGQSNCSSDRRHVLNLTAVAETPRFENDTLRMIASGWRLAPIYRIRSGSWMSITAGANLDRARNGTAVANQPADQVLPYVYGDRSGRPDSIWLNRDAFAQPALGTIGNINPRNVLGPKNWQFDVALSRTFQVREDQRIEARAEAYNVTNSFRPQNPNTAQNNQFFGQIRSAQDTRILQFALKYVF
jgi:hypothetical protein